jgi:hypothetical protein
VVAVLLEAFNVNQGYWSDSIVTSLGALAPEHPILRARLLEAGREGEGRALDALSRIAHGDEAARDVLYEAFGHAQDHGRMKALRRLAPAVEASPEIRRTMISCLEDPDSLVARVATRALASFVSKDEEIREAFLRKLDHPSLRADIAVALASLFEVSSKLQLALPGILKEASILELSQLLAVFGSFAEENETLRLIPDLLTYPL